MASGPIRDPKTDDLLTPQNSALVIIDYQPLQVNSIASMDRQLLVNHIVAVAKARGLRRLNLETGSGPAFEPALALYRKRGFVDGEAFSDYRQSDFNQFLHLSL